EGGALPRPKKDDTAVVPPKPGKIDRQRAGPFAFTLNRQFRRVERVPWQKQLALEVRRPTGLDESQTELFIRSINFIAHNWSANPSEMHPTLVRPSGMRNRPNQTEFVVTGRSRFNKSSFDMQFSLCRLNRGMHA